MSQVVIQQKSREEWEKNLNQFQHSLFITPEWVEAVSDEKHIPIYLDLLIDDTITGKISGLKLKRKKNGLNLYFYAGPALRNMNQDNYNNCLDVIRKFAKNNSFSVVRIDSFDNKHSIKYTGNKYYLIKRVEYIVPVNIGIEELKLKKRFKRNVKRGIKAAPIIKDSKNTNRVDDLLKLLESTKKIRVDKYNEYYDPFYLINLNELSIRKLLASGFAHLRYTQKGSSIDSMELNLEKNKSVYMLLKGTDKEGYDSGLSAFLSFQLIKYYNENGFHTYNQGGRVPGKGGDGLETYKRSMGAQKITVYGASSNYLTYPYKLLNPIFNLATKYRSKNSFANFIYKSLY